MKDRSLPLSLLLAGLLLPTGLPAEPTAPDPDLSHAVRAQAAVTRGLEFLERAQRKEGFWSSPDFPGLTGLVVQAYLLSPEGLKAHPGPVDKGLAFLRSHAQSDGGIYNKGMSNYNTAIALTTLLRANRKEDAALIEGARTFLIGAQKMGSDEAAQDGGFGYEPEGRRSRPDLDNTVFALEALALYRETHRGEETPGGKDLNWKAALEFVGKCQNLPATNPATWASDEPADRGGFTYSPSGGEEGTHSYGSMSYAGLLSLVHAEVDADDERVRAALDWLSRHYTLDENPGQGFEGLYYYYFVMAKALSAAGLESLRTTDGQAIDWKKSLSEKILALQKPDGSWANDNGRWMEKDPVLATSYMVLALEAIRSAPHQEE